MTKKERQPRRRLWRLSLLVLVILPFLPEVAIYAVMGLAKARGCTLDNACRLNGTSLGDFVGAALQAGLFVSFGFGLGLVAVWIVLCCCTITNGWSRLSSRLLIALFVSIIFAGPLYVAPNIALGNLANSQCAAKGEGSCKVFGAEITATAKDVAYLPYNPVVFDIISQKFPINADVIQQKDLGAIGSGFVVAALAFLLYAIFAITVAIISERRAASLDSEET
jgi:hypothetical protein